MVRSKKVNPTSKLDEAVKAFKEALKYRQRADQEHIFYAGLAKCFETCLEYAWKQLKRDLEDQGVDAFSPKEIVKAAGRMGLINDVETWIMCINVRNFAVHDYLGISKQEYLDTIERFMPLVTQLVRVRPK